MNDLFSSNLTTEERINNLKKEIIQYKKLGNKTKVNLFFGSVSDINNNVTIIMDPPESNFFKSQNDNLLKELLKEFEITKYFITYNYLLHDKANVKDIKEFSYFTKKLVDILNPKLIVCMGENSQFCFFKKKFIINDFHGKIIGDYEYINIITTYPVNYYFEHSKLEDINYKNVIKNIDWSTIKLCYDSVIKE